MPTLESLSFNNRFARLPDDHYARVLPDPLDEPHLVSFNTSAAKLIGLDESAASCPDFIDYCNGGKLLAGSDPLAMLYAGHQFGHYVQQLGDGRAIMLGEVIGADGEGWELQLKGSGKTPFSRDGDGRAVLRSTIREYLCSAAMAGLGIPTTRALCVIGSGEEVYREQIETGAVLVRMAQSHIRFGSFEVHFHRRQFDLLKQLADHVIEHHYPRVKDSQEPYLELLKEVVVRTANLIAQWQLVGFSHGVMNTDNMSILGLTLDYGPYGFLDTYDGGFVCNHSDHHGRYAYDQQPHIGLWNLNCLAYSILPLLDADNSDVALEKARAALGLYEETYTAAYYNGMRGKLGFLQEDPRDKYLIDDLFSRMQSNGVDYTIFFRTLGGLSRHDVSSDTRVRNLFVDRDSFDQWAIDYRQRLAKESVEDAYRKAAMCNVNPKYILRNYLAQVAIERAQHGDFSEIDKLLLILSHPFDKQPEHQPYADHPPAWAQQISVSCSS